MEQASSAEQSSTGLVPLTDLGAGTYQGYTGGLYPSGTNSPPPAHLQAGMARAAMVEPRDLQGRPDPAGRIVLLSIGMSNTSMEFTALRHILPKTVNPRLAPVDGAQHDQDAELALDSAGPYWQVVEERLSQAGASAGQVQVVWLKQAIAEVCETFPADAQRLQRALESIVQILAQRYPNLQLVYLSSRVYAGYASITLNQEPHAYQSGFAVKWLIEDQIEGKSEHGPSRNAARPWLGWGPYLWADGTAGRSDGLTWTRQNFLPDGTHPSMSGCLKVARQLLHFFRTDETARSWFLAAEEAKRAGAS